MKLLKIDEHPNQEMWDIEIEDSHCFFANGVLVHNSNGSTRYDKSGELVAQSRERELSLLSDNHGFYSFVFKREKLFRELCENLIQDNDQVVVYGEYFGSGINGGVAVNQLSKRFAIFGIRWIKEGMLDIWADTISLNSWLDPFIQDLNDNDIYNITQFGTWKIDIDFNSPELAQNKLIEITNEIERECPVGRYFGISGIGEGLVASHNGEHFYQLKSKGTLHSNTKVKILNPIDEELLKSVKEFANNFVTESRLKQGVEFLKTELLLEPTPENTGAFIKHIVTDIFKEENENILVNNLNPKKVAQEIGTLARKWYFNYIDENE